MTSKVIKIRSLENGIYTPDYNRMRFEISEDNLSTDLSESYLAFKMYIVNGLTKLPYTQAEILNLDKSNIMFALGDAQGESYSSACMIKTARLFSLKGEMTLLEEIQYSNVISQALNQISNNFETLASESLLTMGSTGFLRGGSVSSSLGSYFGAELSLSDPAVQVNIKLSDLFGLCRSNNFWTSMTSGLQIELELEPSKPLIQQRVGVELSTPLPATLSGGIGFTENYTTNSKSILAKDQNLYSTSAIEMSSSSTKIETPESYYYSAKKYVDYMIGGTSVETPNLIVGKNYQITDLGGLTPAEWVTCGAAAGAVGPDIDTAALKIGVSYEVKTLGALDVLAWNTAGAAINAGDGVATTALTPGNFYKIKTLGTLTLGNWTTAGWLGAALPIVGDAFECAAAVAATDGTCDTLTLPVASTTIFTAIAITTAGGVCVVPGGQYVGQHFECAAKVTPAGGANGVCMLLDSDGNVVSSPGASSNKISFLPAIDWTIANMDTLGMKDDVNVNLTFKLKQSGKVDRFFSRKSLITQRVAHTGVTGPIITLDDTYVYPDFTGTALAGCVVSLDHFEVYPFSGLENDIATGIKLTAAEWSDVVSSSTAVLTPAQVEKLQIAGLLSGGTIAQVTSGLISELSGANVMFKLGVNMDIANSVSIYPDTYESADIASIRKLYSNQTKDLPAQGGLCRIVKAVKDGANWKVTFSNLGLNNDNSIQASMMVNPLGVLTAATNVYLKFSSCKLGVSVNGDQMVVGESYLIYDVGTTSNAEWVLAGNSEAVAAVGQSFVCAAPLTAGTGKVAWLQSNRSNANYQAKSWQITKAELVLVQNPKDLSLPPSMIYPTFKCEAVTIEGSSLSEYQRQFIVSEPNCFSVMLLTPDYSGAGESLISHSRNIEQYRWSVQNIDNTNRNIVIKSNASAYPSSLHLDKFMDCMRNDVVPMKSLSGVNSVARSVDAPVCFPLKIYTASDAESSYLNPLSGYTLQFAGYADPAHDKYIVPGACMLFKFCYKTL